MELVPVMVPGKGARPREAAHWVGVPVRNKELGRPSQKPERSGNQRRVCISHRLLGKRRRILEV